jgi:hypothetical protein
MAVLEASSILTVPAGPDFDRCVRAACSFLCSCIYQDICYWRSHCSASSCCCVWQRQLVTDCRCGIGVVIISAEC